MTTRTRFSRISLQKLKISRNRFCLNIWGPRWSILIKKSRKSRDIVPLSQARIQFEEGRRNPYCNKHFGLGCVLCNVQLCMDDSLDLECLISFFCALKMITILHILAISILPWPPILLLQSSLGLPILLLQSSLDLPLLPSYTLLEKIWQRSL